MSNIILSKESQLTVWEFAQKLAKSKMIPVHFFGFPEEIFVAVLYGNELGLQPIMALNSMCMIQGSVTLKVQTMNAIVRNKHPNAVIDIEIDHDNLIVTVSASRSKGERPYVTIWNMKRANEMGLTSKNNWKVQPLNMLKARALSDALRTVFPDSLLGLFSTEEMEDVPAQPVTKDESKAMLDQDFPIPPEEKVVGDLYRVQNGKFRSKQLKDLSVDDIAEYREELLARKTMKDWEKELISVFGQYLKTIEGEVVTV